MHNNVHMMCQFFWGVSIVIIYLSRSVKAYPSIAID